ncbi:type IV pilus modification protein PilV [Seongchinamella unica]|nr:type IV pilus modification protein PilV [Seongchinamella unica]
MRNISRQSGALMIEVLVTIAIVVIGLLGLLNLQTRLQVSEMESYQRTQALMLLDDMAHRIMTNRFNAASYTTDPTDGVGVDTTNCGSTTAVALDVRDKAEWCEALKGAAEETGTTKVGAMVGGRGCVELIGTGGVQEYLVTVAWQGLTPVAQPPAGIKCGLNKYNLPAGSECATKADFCRRYVSTIVRIADLTDL